MMQRKWFFEFRLAVIAVLLGTLVFLETQHSIGSSRFFTFVAVFLLLAVIASLARAKVRDASLALASVAFGLCVVEGSALVLERPTSTTYTDGLYAPDAALGWRASHAGRYHDEKVDQSSGKVIYRADYTIDEHLSRKTLSSKSGPTVAFFGDSFTFGIGLNDADTLPQQFSSLLDHKARVLNLAYGAYGPQQFLRALEENLYDDMIGPDPIAFVYLTVPWHAERTACRPDWVRPAPRYVLENNKPVLKGTCRDGQYIALRDWFRDYASYRLLIEPLILRPDHDDIELYIGTLLAAVDIARERYGVRTIIPYLRSGPYLQSTGFTDDAVMARLRDGGAIVLDFSLTPEHAPGELLSIPGDGHPTALANRLKATMLKDYVERNMAGTVISGLR